MKYISAIVGTIILVYLISLQKVEVFGLTCRVMSVARSGYGGDPACMNEGFFTFGVILGLAMLVIGGVLIAKDLVMSGVASSSSSTGSTATSSHSSTGTVGSASDYSVARPSYTPPADKYDRKKWDTLKEVDPDIARAAAEVSALSLAYEAKLAEKFQTLNDKSYLPALVEGIKAEHAKKIESTQMALAKADAEMDDRKKAARQAREERSRTMMQEIERNDMFSKRDGKHVVSMEMYYGNDADLHGHAKLIFDDGLAVLRAGDYFTIIPANFE